MNDWFKEWFTSEDYLMVYQHRDKSDGQKLAKLILNNIRIKNNASVLDAGCGAGRHAIYFASLGFDVVGFDLSKTLLQKAKFYAKQESVNLHFIQADFRNIFFKKKFDLVLNLFTSFGYFLSDEENFKFVQAAYYFIKIGGYYILDYFNNNYLKRNLVTESKKSVGCYAITEERSIVNDRVVKKILVAKEGVKKVFTESVKLYDKDFLLEKLRSFGYKVSSIFGDYDGSIYDDYVSPRLLIIIKR